MIMAIEFIKAETVMIQEFARHVVFRGKLATEVVVNYSLNAFDKSNFLASMWPVTKVCVFVALFVHRLAYNHNLIRIHPSKRTRTRHGLGTLKRKSYSLVGGN